jgi:hypothetical protein
MPNGKCWMRDYENAKIMVNPTNDQQRIVIKDKNKWLDWSRKKASNEFIIAPQTGKIFLPTPYKVNPLAK